MGETVRRGGSGKDPMWRPDRIRRTIREDSLRSALAGRMAAMSIDFGGSDAHSPARMPQVSVQVESRESLEAAFAEVARAHEGALVAFATRLAGNADDARDLVQDTLERALRRFASFEPGTNPRAWLYSILHHAFIDRCRRRATEPRRMSIDDVDLPSSEPEEPPAWTSITVEQLRTAIARLEPASSARSTSVHAIEGVAYQEILDAARDHREHGRDPGSGARERSSGLCSSRSSRRRDEPPPCEQLFKTPSPIRGARAARSRRRSEIISPRARSVSAACSSA